MSIYRSQTSADIDEIRAAREAGGRAEQARLARGAQIAEVHLASVNASRKRCRLAPLTATELAHEFADPDRAPSAPPRSRA